MIFICLTHLSLLVLKVCINSADVPLRNYTLTVTLTALIGLVYTSLVYWYPASSLLCLIVIIIN